MAHITINGKTIPLDGPMNLVEAAQRVGIEIPTLCYLKETGALTTCMLCVVKDVTTGRMVPACATQAKDGMCIDTESDAVRNARREILRMLLNEHLGDCRAPCSRICPASANIPTMLRHIAANDLADALRIARRDLVFPATLGRICSAPCEKGCRRKLYDRAIAIQQTHGSLAERALHEDPFEDMSGTPTGKSIAVVGAGIAGMAAAWVARCMGHTCRIFEKGPRACASLRTFSEDELPSSLLDAEIEFICKQGVEIVFNQTIGEHIPLDNLIAEYDAVIVACNLSVPEHEKVFAAEEDAFAIRAVAHGKTAARHADAFLNNTAWNTRPKRFDSKIGALHAPDLDAYAVERVISTAETSPEIVLEAARCLHCDCLKPQSCKLRRYAEEYELGSHFRRQMSTPRVTPLQVCDNVVYESGKCIKCGICVELSRAAGSSTGLTFAGRGLASQVQPPFGDSLASALGSVAAQCVRACPTGALAFRDEEERP